jgi:hypothetical protein
MRSISKIFVLLFCWIAHPSHATVIIDVNQSGADVVFTYSGTINTTGLPFIFTVTNPPSPSITLNQFGTSQIINITTGMHDIYGGIGAVLPLGTPGSFQPDTSTGDSFAINGIISRLELPLGYISGANITGSMTFLATDFATLGLTDGLSFTITLPNDTITYNANASASAVPAPAAVWLLISAFAPLLTYRKFAANRKQAALVPSAGCAMPA